MTGELRELIRDYALKEPWRIPDDARPIVLAPCSQRRAPFTENMLYELRWRFGWGYLPIEGSKGVTKTRSALASVAMEFPSKWQFWCDDDNWHQGEAIVCMWQEAVARDLDFLAAVVPMAQSAMPNIRPFYEVSVPFGANGGVFEVRAAGLAMAITHRRVFERMHEILEPVEYDILFHGAKIKGRPYFSDWIKDGIHWGEDFGFCERARSTGSRIWIDTRVIGLHKRTITSGLEDMVAACQAQAQPEGVVD